MIAIIIYIPLGYYLKFTIAPKPSIPIGAFTPSIHAADIITISGE